MTNNSHPTVKERVTLRKVLISQSEANASIAPAGSWLDLDKVATVELSSEDPEHPFEHALRPNANEGWKAATPGPQVIRIRFDAPSLIRRVHLVFLEEIKERAQEIALFATQKADPRRELVRQQWVFSPSGSKNEVEDFYFDLRDVVMLELQIDPGRHNKEVFATLQTIQISNSTPH
jgi:hypothetical protein